MPEKYWWLILVLPLLSAASVALVLRPFRAVSMGVSLLSAWVSFAVALWGFWSQAGSPESVRWMSVGGLSFQFGLVTDGLAKVMLLVVTGVGALIHLFSTGYMSEDPGKSRFFGCLSLFMFSMSGVVLSDNLAMTFVFWELVGVSSYLLIGFWFEKPSASAAANKAFIVNRIGDFGFMIGILTVWSLLGSLNYTQLQSFANDGRVAAVPAGLLTVAVLGLFCGAVGKSAQVPLHVWLPDAMEGPTPVSALIHAATMVAAGIYFLCRVFFLVELSPVALSVIAGIGGLTAIFAALIATQQDDIKRVLAYSTLSQLGYMVLAVGLGSPAAGMFHLTTHAFFKALLFLGAGSLIHAAHHEQNIWKMGGLGKKMPVTFVTFAIGTLALCGCPFLSGFYSKDAILIVAYETNRTLFWVALGTALLTSFYMTRLFVVSFLGEPRGDGAAHAHESPWAMTLPLVVLALLSIVGGYGSAITGALGLQGLPHTHPMAAVGGSVAVFVLGSLAGFLVYRGAKEEKITFKILKSKFYVDEIYEVCVVRASDAIAAVVGWMDTWIIGGVMVRGVALCASVTGQVFRIMQAGNVQVYAFWFALGVAVMLYWMMGR